MSAVCPCERAVKQVASGDQTNKMDGIGQQECRGYTQEAK